MALVGGGGAANTVNPAGTGSSLNYVGDHCYANSGGVDVDNSITTMLEFTTENIYAMVDMTVGNSSGSGDDMEFEVLINSEKILSFGVSASNAFPPNSPTLLIPPYSKVTITGLNLTSSSARQCFVTLAGRVYA